MKFPNSREHSFPSARAGSLFESEAILYLSPTRWLLLIFGCVLPEVSGAVIVFKISPALSVLLFAASLSTVAFILTFLRKQKCVVRIYQDTIELQTKRNRTQMKKKDIFECSLGQAQNVVVRHRDEIQVLGLQSPEAFQEAFRKMIST